MLLPITLSLALAPLTRAPAPRLKAPLVPPDLIACYGCGAEVQTDEPDALGYVSPQVYDLKARHRKQKADLLCERCKRLTQGEVLPAVVEGRLRRRAAADSAGITTPEALRETLLPLRERKALVALLVDLTDFSGTLLPRVRDLIAGNPVVLIGTKADLLPRGTDPDLVLAWMERLASRRLGGIVDCHVVSAKQGEGMKRVARSLLTTREGRDLVLIGAANVGKSLFLGALLEYCPNAAAARRRPISSATPGTTLGLVKLDVFTGGSSLYDTPGVHLAHRLTAQLLPDELKAVMPRRRMRPFTPPPVAAGTSFFWGALVRVDVVDAPSAMRLSFCGFGMRVHECHTAGAEEEHRARAGIEWQPPSSAESAAELGKLIHARTVTLELLPTRREADIAVSGLGWISIGCLPTLQKTALRAVLEIWAPSGVEVYLRPPMPVEGVATPVPALESQ